MCALAIINGLMACLGNFSIWSVCHKMKMVENHCSRPHLLLTCHFVWHFVWMERTRVGWIRSRKKMKKNPLSTLGGWGRKFLLYWNSIHLPLAWNFRLSLIQILCPTTEPALPEVNSPSWSYLNKVRTRRTKELWQVGNWHLQSSSGFWILGLVCNWVRRNRLKED